MSQLGKPGTVLMVCRLCHKKDLLALMDEPLTAETSTLTIAGTGTGSAAYVSPSMREDTSGPDLMELFRPFSAVTCCHVAIDQKTSMSRGFGFVNFVSREDAQRAINTLNGYGYDNLILTVEWATPKPN
ncbi:unnamed protein product [Arabidopsis halleri]